MERVYIPPIPNSHNQSFLHKELQIMRDRLMQISIEYEKGWTQVLIDGDQRSDFKQDLCEALQLAQDNLSDAQGIIEKHFPDE